MTTSIRVLVVDADRSSAAVMTACLRKHGFRVERPLHNLSRLHERLNSFERGVVILGAETMAEQGVLAGLVKSFPEIAFIVCTQRPIEAPLAWALSCGAKGYLVSLGGQHLRELPTAVNAVAAGEVYLTELVASLAPPPKPPSAPLTEEEAIARLQAVLGLTRKEAEVGLLVQRGWLEKQIGTELGISHHTAHGRLRRLYQRAGVKGIRELVRVATEALLSGSSNFRHG